MDCCRLDYRVGLGNAKRVLKKGSAKSQEKAPELSQLQHERQKTLVDEDIDGGIAATYASEEEAIFVSVLWGGWLRRACWSDPKKIPNKKKNKKAPSRHRTKGQKENHPMG